ncbi:hypothetical protein [Anaerosalibacter sp. Marseille-P3206]|nr:hypothetical protein [Anaerosalibacter sp. Marseille-P3206]
MLEWIIIHDKKEREKLIMKKAMESAGIVLLTGGKLYGISKSSRIS